MTNIDAAGPAQRPGIASPADDTAPLARDFQDLLTSGKGGAPAVVTITLPRNGGTASSQPGGFAKPVVITAVNGQDRPPGERGGLEAGHDAPGGGPMVITAVHGEPPTVPPDAVEPGLTTITAVRGSGTPEREPEFRTITAMHGGEQPTALPDASGPRMVTITAVREGGASHGLPALRVITMVHGGDHPTALPDAAIPRTITITVVNKPD